MAAIKPGRPARQWVQESRLPVWPAWPAPHRQDRTVQRARNARDRRRLLHNRRPAGLAHGRDVGARTRRVAARAERAGGSAIVQVPRRTQINIKAARPTLSHTSLYDSAGSSAAVTVRRGRILMHECSNCRGEKTVDCPVCHGSGKRFVGFHIGDCKECAGTGKRSCSVCGGTGVVQTPPQSN
jgi:hypothetical protein